MVSGPESYTGEDMAEIQVHGSKAVIDALHSSISNIENCLNHHKNKKVVATASVAQVRAPVYKSSINKWKNVEKQLIELKKIIN